MSALPPGFVLDEEPHGLPPGFVLDEHPADVPQAAREGGSAKERGLRGAFEPIVGLGQKIAHVAATLPVDALKENAATYDDFAKQYQGDSDAMAPEGFDVARTAGNIVSPINLAAATKGAQLATKLPLLYRALAAAPVGAALGLSQPVTGDDFGSETAQQAGIGAALGPVSEVGGTAVSRVIAPKITQAARALIGENVRLTPGQMLGGMAQTVEDKAMSIPILGDAIRSARLRGNADLNVAAANRALSPLGQRVPKGIEAGHDLTAHVEKTLGDAYDTVLPKITFRPDMQTAQELGTIWQSASRLPQDQARQFDKILQDTLLTKANAQGVMDGQSFKSVESELTRLSNGYMGSASAGERELGQTLKNVLGSLRQTLVRANPAEAGTLQKINQGYANFARIRQAGSSVAAEDGVFTPAQLHNAVKAKDRSAGKGRFATGNALMQDLSGAAKSAMSSKIPNSGTTDRLLLAGGAATASGLFAPNALLPLIAGGALYTRPGQALMRGYLSGSAPQNALSAAVQRGALPAGLSLLPAIQGGGN